MPPREAVGCVVSPDGILAGLTATEYWRSVSLVGDLFQVAGCRRWGLAGQRGGPAGA